MFMSFVGSIVSLMGQCWSWFFDLLDGMANGGAGLFISVFLGLFSLSKFIDLFLMSFLYSPTADGASDNSNKSKSRSRSKSS